jgi:hypothetical protein
MGALKLEHEKLPGFKIVQLNDGELGVENVKIIFTIAIAFFTDLITAIRNKNYFLLLNIVANLLKYGNIVVIAQTAWKEFKDTSQPESEQIVAHIKAEFDLEDDDLEKKIETALTIVPEIYDLVLDALGLFGRGKDLYDRIVALFGEKGTLKELANAA